MGWRVSEREGQLLEGEGQFCAANAAQRSKATASVLSVLKLLLLRSVRACVCIYQCLDGSQRLEEASQQVAPPLIGQQAQTGLSESFLGHAQLPTRGERRRVEEEE